MQKKKKEIKNYKIIENIIYEYNKYRNKKNSKNIIEGNGITQTIK